MFYTILFLLTVTSNVLTKGCLLSIMEGFKKEFVTEMEGFKRDVFDEVVSFRTYVNHLTTYFQLFPNKIDSSGKMVQQLNTQFSQLKKENEKMKNKIVVLSDDVRELRVRLRSLEQYSTVSNIEINGLPATRDEYVKDLLKNLAAAIGVEVPSSDNSEEYPIPSFRKERDPALTNRTKREEQINKYRKKRSAVIDQQVNQQFPPQLVYINNQLSPENKQLLSKLQENCREDGNTFPWCRNAKVFASKLQVDPSFEDIEKL